MGAGKRGIKMAIKEMRAIVSDTEIELVHGKSNFGSMRKRDVVNLGVLKCASGYYQGSTSKQIIKQHGLIDSTYILTEKGRSYLWAAFGDGIF